MRQTASTPPAHTTDTTRLIQIRLRSAGRYNEWIHSLLAPHVGRRILDAGCGIGNVTRLFLDQAELVIGYECRADFCELIQAELGARPNLRIVQGDLAHLDAATFAAEALDTVLCVNVLEHIECDVDLLRQFRAMLAPGGRVCLFVPAHPWLYGAHDAADGHFRRYTKGGLGEALGQAGLEVEVLRWVNLPGILAWWLNKLRRRVAFGDSQCGAFDRAVPVIARLEALFPPPIGLSLLAVAAQARNPGCPT